MKKSREPATSGITFENILFGLATFFVGLITHAVAYFAHEYAHTFTAWALGWMPHPLALDYGHPTLYNLIFLGDVSDNVDYAPIFSSGHGVSAAVIALAGPFLGNGALYFLLYRLIKSHVVAGNRAAVSFIYWLAVMCAANVWCYVPIRAIATHADIALAAQGLQISNWLLLPFLLVPSLYVVFHFFCKMFPSCYRVLVGDSANNLTLLIVVTACWYFSFLVGDAIGGSYGPLSQLLAIASRYLLFSLAAVYLFSRYYPTRTERLLEGTGNGAPQI